MQPVMETILHRRSIRRFAPEQIREETLAQILQAGLYAPSAGGRQGGLFAVCQDREHPPGQDQTGQRQASDGQKRQLRLPGAAQHCR